MGNDADVLFRLKHMLFPIFFYGEIESNKQELSPLAAIYSTLLSVKKRAYIIFFPKISFIFSVRITNLLLTELECRIGEYWLEVVAVRKEHSEVRTETTEGQYSPVRSRANEVNKLFITWHRFSERSDTSLLGLRKISRV